MHDLTCPIMDVEPLLPHSGAMVFLDKIIDWDEKGLTAETMIKADNLLLRHGQFDTFSSIEIMAQAVGAWAGCMHTSRGEPIGLGFLLGTRCLNLFSQTIAIGTQLIVETKLSIQDQSGFSVFDCCIKDKSNGEILASAALSVYSPKKEEGKENE